MRWEPSPLLERRSLEVGRGGTAPRVGGEGVASDLSRRSWPPRGGTPRAGDSPLSDQGGQGRQAPVKKLFSRARSSSGAERGGASRDCGGREGPGAPPAADHGAGGAPGGPPPPPRRPVKPGEDELPCEQSHIWEHYLHLHMKPRTKSKYLASLVEWRRGRPFPWRILLVLAAYDVALVATIMYIPGPAGDEKNPFRQWLEAKETWLLTFMGVVTFILATGLAFRVNIAHTRWWEGRTLWGSFINNTRDLARQALTYIPEPELAVKTALWTYIIANVLKHHLRGSSGRAALQQIREMESALVTEPELFAMEHADHKPMMAIKFTSEALHSSGLDPIMKAHLDGALRAVVHDLGGMERILRCPMPFGYTTHNRLMILLWCFALPLCLIEVVGVASIPVAFLVSYLIIGEEDVAAEIENPFGVDANDLPLDQFTTTIRSNIFELLCFQGHKREGAGGGAGPQVRVPRRESALNLDGGVVPLSPRGPVTPVRVEERGILDELQPDDLM